MYTQVYFHDVRRVYDLHLKEFLQGWLEVVNSRQMAQLMPFTDHEVLVAMRGALSDPGSALGELASRALARSTSARSTSWCRHTRRNGPLF